MFIRIFSHYLSKGGKYHPPLCKKEYRMGENSQLDFVYQERLKKFADL